MQAFSAHRSQMPREMRGGSGGLRLSRSVAYQPARDQLASPVRRPSAITRIENKEDKIIARLRSSPGCLFILSANVRPSRSKYDDLRQSSRAARGRQLRAITAIPGRTNALTMEPASAGYLAMRPIKVLGEGHEDWAGGG